METAIVCVRCTLPPYMGPLRDVWGYTMSNDASNRGTTQLYQKMWRRGKVNSPLEIVVVGKYCNLRPEPTRGCKGVFRVAGKECGHVTGWKPHCYDPPPFFSSPPTVTITTPAAPAPAPVPVPAASPARAVTPVARRAPAHTPTSYVYPSLPEALIPVRAILPSHTAASPTPQLRGEPDVMDVDDKSPTPRRQGAQESRTTTPRMQPIPQPVLPKLDIRDHPLSRPAVSHAASSESDHLPFPMLTDDIASHEYVLHWLADHPGYTMQGEGLESVQVPSVRPVSPDSPVSSTRRRRLDSGGGWTSKPPTSPESIPIPTDIQSQEQSPCDSQVQEAEAGGERSQHHALPPLSILVAPPVPTQYSPAAEASTLDDATIPGGYLR